MNCETAKSVLKTVGGVALILGGSVICYYGTYAGTMIATSGVIGLLEKK